MKKLIISILLSFLITSCGGSTVQKNIKENIKECECEKEFAWMKKTFEENDAGFLYVINQKGEEEYKKHNEIFLEKIKNARTSIACGLIMKDWLHFFRASHLSITVLDSKSNNKKQSNNDFKDINLDTFKEYIENKKEVDYEGIWKFDYYEILIKKYKDNYIGYVIGLPKNKEIPNFITGDAEKLNWDIGDIKLKINIINKKADVTFYLNDHSPIKTKEIKLIGKNLLRIGRRNIKRISPKVEEKDTKELERFIRVITTNNPLLEEVNENTLLLRIPSFNHTEKKKIDKVIIDNKEKILKTQNLIIDLRDNGGGAEPSYSELLPFIYTNPIRTISDNFLSTPLNNERMKIIASGAYKLPKEVEEWAEKSYKELNKHLGEFVSLEEEITIKKFDKITKFPNNIGIIINSINGSTAEQFLLTAKQSKKVKLFGVTTAGVLDISNMNFVKSPSKKFELGYSLSKSLRIPDMKIDGIGIQPDYYIDKSIPQYKWIDFVSDVLNQE